MDDDLAEEVLDYFAEQIRIGAMPRAVSGAAATTGFSSGRADFMLSGDWEVATFTTAELPFSMTKFPHLYPGRYVTRADSHTLVLPKNPRRSAARLDKSLEFIRSLVVKGSLTWASSGHVPAWLPVTRTAVYRKLKPQSTYASAARDALYAPAAWYGGAGSSFEYIVGGYIDAVLGRNSTPRAAVRGIRRDLEKLARTAPPVG
jgi:multiple sugar transport system substrate-binding protein